MHGRAINRATCCRVRFLPVIAMAFTAHLAASETTPTYPLWDGVESVADYANRFKLPQTKTLELCDNVKMELVLNALDNHRSEPGFAILAGKHCKQRLVGE